MEQSLAAANPGVGAGMPSLAGRSQNVNRIDQAGEVPDQTRPSRVIGLGAARIERQSADLPILPKNPQS